MPRQLCVQTLVVSVNGKDDQRNSSERATELQGEEGVSGQNDLTSPIVHSSLGLRGMLRLEQ